VQVRVGPGAYLQTLPAEVCLALRAEHFVAAVDFLNWISAGGTSFGAHLDVVKVHSLIHGILSFPCLLVARKHRVYCLLGFQFGRLAPLKRVHLHRALSAEFEKTLSAFAKALYFVNLCRLAALLQRAPPKVLHFVDSLADGKLSHFLDQLCGNSDLNQLFLCD